MAFPVSSKGFESSSSPDELKRYALTGGRFSPFSKPLRSTLTCISVTRFLAVLFSPICSNLLLSLLLRHQKNFSEGNVKIMQTHYLTFRAYRPNNFAPLAFIIV